MYENPFITRIDIKIYFYSLVGIKSVTGTTLSGLNIINLERCIDCLC